MDWKRIGIVFGFLATVIGLGFLIYFIFFAPAEPEIVTEPTPVVEPTTLPTSGAASPTLRLTSTSTLPQTAVEGAKTAQEAQGGLVRVSELETRDNRSPRLASDGSSLITFDGIEGKFYRITPDGRATQISDSTFKGARDITWSPRSDRAVISFLDDANIMYDFTTQKQVTLPKHWEEFNFSPEGDRIGFKSMADDPENRWLAIANADGSAGKLLEPLGKKAQSFDVSWSPSDQIIGTFREGMDGNRQRLYFIGFNGENFKSTVINGRGVETKWTPKGDRLLYSAYSPASGYKPELWIVDALGDTIGNNRRRISLETWAHKCSFANDTTLYCAVPIKLEEGAGLIPSSVESPEAIYKVDLSSGSRQKIAELPEGISSQELIITEDQSLLYVNDAYSGVLHSVKLR